MTAAARRIRLDLTYDGTDYSGWQVQPATRTVQGVLESILATVQGEGTVTVRGASRTDAGVHARGQVADAWIKSRLPDDRLRFALNGILPADIRVAALATVDDEFHARHRALWKTYRYVLDRSDAGDPFVARYAVHHPFEMDVDALRTALTHLPGKRDWSGFSAAKCEVDDRVRTLSEATYHESAGGTAAFTFSADGFLTHMVRNLVGTVLEIARGKFKPGRIDEILLSGNRRLGGPTAPAQGLCLERIVYAEPRQAR